MAYDAKGVAIRVIVSLESEHIEHISGVLALFLDKKHVFLCGVPFDFLILNLDIEHALHTPSCCRA